MPQASSELKIVAADASQIPIILSFIRKLAEYEKLAHEVVADETLLREFIFGPKPASEVLLAFIGDRPVGFAIFFTSFSTFAGRPGLYLEDLFVDQDARGQGVGKALLSQVAKLAVVRGYARLEWTVLDWNQPSIEFYHRLGAVPLSDWTKYRLTGEALENVAGCGAQ